MHKYIFYIFLHTSFLLSFHLTIPQAIQEATIVKYEWTTNYANRFYVQLKRENGYSVHQDTIQNTNIHRPFCECQYDIKL